MQLLFANQSFVAKYGMGSVYLNCTSKVLLGLLRDAAAKNVNLTSGDVSKTILTVSIPLDDSTRASVYGDPAFGVVKQLVFQSLTTTTTTTDSKTSMSSSSSGSSSSMFSVTVPANQFATVSADLNTILLMLDFVASRSWFDRNLLTTDVNQALATIHANVMLDFGSFQEELPEQRMAARYISPTARVLEIGGNIGRNSLVIATILQNQSNLVVVESDPASVDKLTHNRNLNGYNFFIEGSALSSRRLIQHGWSTAVCSCPTTATMGTDSLKGCAGCRLFVQNRSTAFEVKTISNGNLQSKYKPLMSGLGFDTLVADCEGALFPILSDTPELLDGITTIVLENDFQVEAEKIFCDKIFAQKGFRTVYSEAGGFGPCINRFYEVWKKL